MAQAIVLRAYGGPEVLVAEEVAVGQPGPGELLVRQTAIGVNFHDIYVRSGLYKTLALPGIPGIEAAGVVEAVGLGVEGFSPGDRVGCVTAEYRRVRVGAHRAGGPSVSAAGVGGRPDGGGGAGQGPDRGHADRAGAPGEVRRQGAGACRGRWGRADAVPAAEIDRRGGDWHGRQRGEGGDRPGSRL